MENLSHAETHANWSAGQITAFRAMSAMERLNAVKSGALEHWTEEDRNDAINLLGEITVDHDDEGPRACGLEPARLPLPRIATHSLIFDRFVITTIFGWFLLVITIAGRAYNFY